MPARFDRVLVDAPCTGTGTWRRNPDARLRLTETDLDELMPKQANILDTAQRLVRKGGRLVYATCSLLEEENEAQVTAFLIRHPEFAVVPLARAWPLEQPPPNNGDFLSLTPAGTARTGFSPRCWSVRRDLAAQGPRRGCDRDWRRACGGLAQHLSRHPARYISRQDVGVAPGCLYDAAIRGGTGVMVATASGADVPLGSGPRIIGFTTSGRARNAEVAGKRLAEGEVETLYVLDDWRERGVGRQLMRSAAGHLVDIGCKSAFLWVLRDNPSRWFYQRLGGKSVAEQTIQIAGQTVWQTAFVWDPIEQLLAASPQAS